MSHRIEQIDELIRTHVGDILSREVSFKAGVLTTISRVDVTRDLRHARIYVSVFPDAESDYAIKTLEHERRVVERGLHERLYMKPLPKIAFFLDGTEREADVVEKLLRDIEGGA